MSALFGGAATSNAASNSTQGDLSHDVQISNPPEDSVSDIRFSPQSDHLAVASWDKKVRIYEIDSRGNSQGKALFEHGGPVLSCCWSKDGSKVFGAGVDKAARMLDLGSGATQAQQVAAHDNAIRCVESILVNGNQMLVTGGWDKMVKYWDLRTDKPAGQVECNERVYAMDARNEMLVVATAERWMHVLNIKNPTTFYKTIQSPLKFQTRSVGIFSPDNNTNGYAVGSIEGRCAIQYVEDKDQSNNFSFKCHRQTSPTDKTTTNVYAVNAISFHPQLGTFSTAGADGTFHFWDKDAKHRLKGYPEVGHPIISTDFDRNGNIFAYAIGYDWSKGYQGNTANIPNKIMLHPLMGDECKPRPKTTKR
ncbi:WD40 repeat-like protein [Piedraia hortae CBS 480.64]|uniref:WD40 repeat-like protein n=1 Tax=Piedraia hortae CBS 480.64 TaxID=1314780 RepID=A0A6A7CA25_9PEZI|nr:WD40 repeat-like protein [Piedraia hortae CBS 480.64]